MSRLPENKILRKSEQDCLPSKKAPASPGRYDIYPSFQIPEGQIFVGYESLAEKIGGHKRVAIDGYAGVFFDLFRERLDGALQRLGLKVFWLDSAHFLKPEHEILKLKEPFLGGSDPLFGTRCAYNLEDIFECVASEDVFPGNNYDINIIAGPGASLFCREAFLVYIDIPKNEIQYRARAGSVTNLGHRSIADAAEMYKCFYFVDWIMLNRHKENILPEIDILIDGQRPDSPSWIDGDDFRSALTEISRQPFRPRPWFEPGPWGGSWIKDNIPGVSRNVPNYAWSFELIAPENGIILESSGNLLEASFDFIMYHAGEALLGDCFSRFYPAFPIRFDFLDTFDGGNLSLQCHPRPEYIKACFGEGFTQEETYYILDNKDNAVVWLGFNDDIDPVDFQRALEESRNNNSPFDAAKYVQSLPSKKHDLFLIPYGTVHGAGKNNLVLEISTTPYIFTFKLYDWLRNDLDGKPRILNIERAMKNIYFDRKGKYIKDSLLARPELIAKGEGWSIFHLATHETHMHDIYRLHISGEIDIRTENKCLVMSLVEGTEISVEPLNGSARSFSYAETFIIPAAAVAVKIKNHSLQEAIVICAFIKNSLQ